MVLYNPPLKDEGAIQSKLRETLNVLENTNEPPEQPYTPKASGKSGNTELPINCQYCKHTRACYEGSGLRIFQSSTGPKYLTKVVREPRMAEITWEEAGKL